MKYILLFLLPFSCFAQQSEYGNIAYSYTNEHSGFNLLFGEKLNKNIGLGLGFDYFKLNDLLRSPAIPVYAETRLFLPFKNHSFQIALQGGFFQLNSDIILNSDIVGSIRGKGTIGIETGFKYRFIYVGVSQKTAWFDVKSTVIESPLKVQDNFLSFKIGITMP